MKKVFVIAEQDEGKIHPISFELLAKGKEIAEKIGGVLEAIILGCNIREEAKELVYYGADAVHVFDDDSLCFFDPIKYEENVLTVIRRENPIVILVGATNIGKSLAPRIAVALKTGLTADCTDIRVEDGEIVQIRPAFVGNIIAHIVTRKRPIMATIRYRVMKPLKRDPKKVGKIVLEKVKKIEDSGIRIIKKVRDKEIRISEANVVVSFGRGLKKPEDIGLIKELANLLNGAIGASRPIIDEGWLSRDHQVGFSGNVVRPKLYIAVGISGSPQHLAGMKNSEIVVAINIDKTAPIFSYADYCIVGDLYRVVPLLINRLRRDERYE